MRSLFTIALFSLCSLSASEEGLGLRRIADFWEEGDYHIAKSQMEEFLIQFPESQYANVLCMALGDLFLREKNYKEALDHYSKVQDQERIFLNTLQCMYHLNWHATLADTCEAYLAKESTDEANKLQATYFLAIALYQQCQNAPKETASVLAERARPYFESLSNSELSSEVAGAFAHLRYILGDYEGASNLYIKLAKESGNSEELLFQAALLQSKYDPSLALKTFDQLRNGPFGPEAAYNQLVLNFDLGQYEQITTAKETWISAVPKERLAHAHLFVGQSFLKMKDYGKAVVEFSSFLSMSAPSEATRNGLHQLVEASYLASDLDLLERSIEQLKAYDPNDQLLQTALFSRSMLLKKEKNFSKATAQLEALLQTHPTFSEAPKVLFELTQLYSLAQNWTETRKNALALLNDASQLTLHPYAWEYALQSCLELQLDAECQELLNHAPLLDPSAKNRWEARLAKLELDLGHFTTAKARLEAMENALDPDAQLLLSLAYKQSGDLASYCKWAELALANGSQAVGTADQHVALFNAYIAQNSLDNAATHLYSAFQEGASIHQSNLVWLADFLLDKEAFEKSYAVLLKTELTDPSVTFNLAELHIRFGHDEEALTILETLDTKEAKLCLAESLLRLDRDKSKAAQLFDEVAATDSMRDCLSAKAALQSARLKQADGKLEEVAVILKNLTLQKTLENEPVHLEAALDYINLQKDPEKQLSLLKRLKSSFESEDDLLSKDYHAARKLDADKNALFVTYMDFLSAQEQLLESKIGAEETSELQKELQTKAKAILLQIGNHTDSPLRAGALERLEELTVE